MDETSGRPAPTLLRSRPKQRHLKVATKADVLLVIDDSYSMSGKQQRLANALQNFTLALDHCEVARRGNHLNREELHDAELEHWAVERASTVLVPTRARPVAHPSVGRADWPGRQVSLQS